MRPLIVIFLVVFFCPPAMAWDFDRHAIPTDEIISGGPPRDGIPALMEPEYVAADKAFYLKAKIAMANDDKNFIDYFYKSFSQNMFHQEL